MQMTRSTNYQTHLNGKLKTIQHCEQVKPGNMPDTMHVTTVNMNMENTGCLERTLVVHMQSCFVGIPKM